MEIWKVKLKIASKSIKEVRDGIITVGIFESPAVLTSAAAQIDRLSGGMIKNIISCGDFTGRLYQTLVLYPGPGLKIKRILLVGLGKKSAMNIEKLRGAASTAACHVRDIGLESFTIPVSFADIKGTPSHIKAGICAESVILGLYRFRQFKSGKAEKNIRSVTILTESNEQLKKCAVEVKKAEVIADAVCIARDLVSRPGNSATPSFLADTAKKISKNTGLTCKIIDAKKAGALGMRAFLGVARGSREPLKFIVMEHKPAAKNVPCVVLVGKAITFDSGGISLKPAARMEEMKMDMAGGAAVIAGMQAIAKLKIPVHVTGIVPATENLPDGNAQKPGDIVKSMAGKTIEIISTDAEGRLILADAITYACRYCRPSAIIDLATLTGACIIALGNDVTAVMGNNEGLIEKLNKAGTSTGEKIWQLPLWEEYKDLIKSDVADIKNAGGRSAGTITAACFLSEFAGEIPWAHLDIAGTAWTTKNKPCIPKGATGVGVRLLVELLQKW